jgi:hypothetical protein
VALCLVWVAGTYGLSPQNLRFADRLLSSHAVVMRAVYTGRLGIDMSMSPSDWEV